MNLSSDKRTGVIYLVKRDSTGTHWQISRDGEPTGGFTIDKRTAVGIACQAAMRDLAAGAVSVWSFQCGKLRKEWPT
jgi:hypothetical protein